MLTGVVNRGGACQDRMDILRSNQAAPKSSHLITYSSLSVWKTKVGVQLPRPPNVLLKTLFL